MRLLCCLIMHEPYEALLRARKGPVPRWPIFRARRRTKLSHLPALQHFTSIKSGLLFRASSTRRAFNSLTKSR